MKNILKLLLVIALFAGCDCSGSKTKQYIKCGQPCYPGPAETLDVGVCRAGIYICDQDGSEPVCAGAILPSDEVCDNKDNDCDGKTDDVKKNCTSACESGTQTCIAGEWGECSARKPADEECNGKDDDCDGIIDNQDKVPVQLCYDGPQNTLAFGQCHPGIKRCENGKYGTCINQELPSPETCNGADDDCDGIIDNGLQMKPVYNIIILDISGSMDTYLQSIRGAFQKWASANTNTQEKFALILVPGQNDVMNTPPVLFLDFSQINVFMSQLMTAQINYRVPEESILDALRMIIETNNPLKLTMPQDADLRVLIFSDEAPQSYFFSSRYKPNEIADDYRLSKIPVYVFTLDIGWNVIPAVTGGAGFMLTNSEIDIFNNLDLILKDNECR